MWIARMDVARMDLERMDVARMDLERMDVANKTNNQSIQLLVTFLPSNLFSKLTSHGELPRPTTTHLKLPS
jgi:hypothetical protein